MHTTIRRVLLFVSLIFLTGLIFSTAVVDANIGHDFSHDGAAATHTIQTGNKLVYLNGQPQIDKAFYDGYGREVYFRGWNVSGSVKLVDHGFLPFDNLADAEAAFRDIRARSGANMIRYTLAWEGIHPAPDTVDTAYLDRVVEQIRAATEAGLYVIIDYHSDLYSRFLFAADSKYTGNGAPEWVVPNYPPEYCVPFCVHWTQNHISNPITRRAYRDFWNNRTIQTTAGQRGIQDEFLWQLDQMVSYVDSNLTADELAYVVGVEPFNEPVYGDGYGTEQNDEYDNEKLWPFYQRVRTVLDGVNWTDKYVFAEPNVLWNTNVGIIQPGGGGYLDDLPGDGFIFTPHFYDARRQGGLNPSPVMNGEYYENFDEIRDEARFLQLPTLVSEYGMFIDGTGARDTTRLIKGMLQSLEVSDRNRPIRDRYLDLYTPLLSGTQWHWDIYHDQHQEYQNGNPDLLITEGDGWNDENFSVVDENSAYTSDGRAIERVYPRRAQGDIFSFTYNDVPSASDGTVLSWASIRPNPTTEYFRGEQFAMLVWRGRNADTPTELFLPQGFSADNLIVITDGAIHNADLVLDAPLTQALNEVAWTSDPVLGSTPLPANAGSRLAIWDDAETGEDGYTMHFALVVDAESSAYSAAELATIQAELIQRIQVERESAVYMVGPTFNAGYPSEAYDPAPITVSTTTQPLILRTRVDVSWSGANAAGVDVYVNDDVRVTAGGSSGSTRVLISNSAEIRVCNVGTIECGTPVTVVP